MGRNQLCNCGSKKKYKKCCGGQFVLSPIQEFEVNDYDEETIDLDELTIPYLILVDTPSKSVFDVPDFLTKTSQATLGMLPRSIMQFWDPNLFYLDLINRFHYFSPKIGFILDSHPQELYTESIAREKYIVGVILSKNYKNFLNAIIKSEKPFFLICEPSFDKKLVELAVPQEQYAFSHSEFVKKFSKFILEKVFRDDILPKDIRNWFLSKKQPQVIIPSGKFKVTNFNPIIYNELIVGHISGAAWYKEIEPAHISDVLERPLYIVNSIKAIDTEHTYGLSLINSKLFKTRSKRRYIYQPLILSLPYINKRHISQYFDFDSNSDIFDKHAFVRGLKCEQDSNNYTIPDIVNQTTLDPRWKFSFGLGCGVKADRNNALDLTSSLHASMTLSPYFRGPATGKSVSYYLRYFDPENFMAMKNPKKIRKQMKLVGDAISNRLGSGIIDYLKTRDGALISISDLPIELANIDETPVFFKFDHCRILETSYGSQLSQFARFSFNIRYCIGTNLLDKALVVCLSPSDENIMSHFVAARTLALGGRLKNVKFAIAETIEELKKLIEDNKPELLILDTHGKNRYEQSDSVLTIGETYLTGEDIVKYGISAPLVILSACFTAPTHGYMNPIAQAFFEVGALSVLSTILPVKITSATVFYIRILNNLYMATQNSIHESWCDFISHNLRTSIWDDYEQEVIKKLRKSRTNFSRHSDWVMHRSKWQMKSLFFESRDESFKNLYNEIASTFNPDAREQVLAILGRTQIVPEAYFYTLLGRADLIKFLSFTEKSNSK